MAPEKSGEGARRLNELRIFHKESPLSRSLSKIMKRKRPEDCPQPADLGVFSGVTISINKELYQFFRKFPYCTPGDGFADSKSTGESVSTIGFFLLRLFPSGAFKLPHGDGAAKSVVPFLM